MKVFPLHCPSVKCGSASACENQKLDGVMSVWLRNPGAWLVKMTKALQRHHISAMTTEITEDLTVQVDKEQNIKAKP